MKKKNSKKEEYTSKLLEEYSLFEIFNIPEIVERELPFPYNISNKNKKITLLSPIKLVKEDFGFSGIYWSISTPTKTIYDYDLSTLISTWNNYIRKKLYDTFRSDNIKNLFVLALFINIILGVIFFHSSINIISTILIVINLLFAATSNVLLNHFIEKDINIYMDRIIGETKAKFTYYNQPIFMGITEPVKIDNIEEKINSDYQIKNFVNALDNIISNINNKNIINILLKIKDINNKINDYIKLNNIPLDDILIKNEMNNIQKFNNNIIAIIDILNKNPDKETINDIENILNNYTQIYEYYEKSIIKNLQISVKSKLEVMKCDLKAQLDYINIIKNDDK